MGILAYPQEQYLNCFTCNFEKVKVMLAEEEKKLSEQEKKCSRLIKDRDRRIEDFLKQADL